jgi:hypothetical protein
MSREDRNHAMRPGRSELPVVAALLASALSTGCSSGGSSPSNHDGGAASDTGVAAADDATTTSPDDASAAASDSGASVAFLRVAQLATALPAADFCVAVPSGGTFRGPLLGQLAASNSAAGDGGTSGLAYAQVSTYFTVGVGAIDVRFVAPGASDCNTPLSMGGDPGDAGTSTADDGGDAGAGTVNDGGDAATSTVDDGGDAGTGTAGDAATGTALEVDGLPALAANSFVTLMVLGAPGSGADGGAPWVEITDDGVLNSGAASLRAVNAVTGAGPQDFGQGSFDGGWGALFTNVAYGSASSESAPFQQALDTNGYMPVAPFDDETMSARASSGATGDTAVGTGASVSLGSIVSVFAVDPAAAVADASAARLLLCNDNGTAIGVLSDCTLLP